jgi:hypothetical protein
VQEYAPDLEGGVFAHSRAYYAELEQWLSGAEAAGLQHAELEEQLHARGQEMLRRLHQGHLDLLAAREQRRQDVPGADGIARTRMDTGPPQAACDGVRRGHGDPDGTAKRPYLDYATALAKGWPIATGVIEGACRHLVKDRMDITGARWGLDGAEAILTLRALTANGDFEKYWPYHLRKEHERVHHARYREGVLLAALSAHSERATPLPDWRYRRVR